MRFRSLSLGTKLSLALLAFLVVLVAATSTIIVFGFNRTQDNANARSREALEEEGKLALMALVGGVSDAGAVQIDWAAEVGQRAARYLEVVKAAGTAGQYDVSGLVRTDNGVWYDPNPDRTTDVVVPNHVALVAGGIADDLAYSAPLDALLPALTGTFPGQIAGEAFKPTAVSFIGINGVGRYYPPIGIHETIPAEVDISDFYDRFGPVGNPDRETLWTPPYEDLAGQGLVLTARSPVYEGEFFRGIIEVDLSIASLVQQVNALKPTASGFTFYVDKNGELLRTEEFDLLNREAEENAEFAAVLEAMKNPPDGRVVVESLTLEGEDVFIAHRAMVPLGGSMASVAPIDEVTAQAALITESIDEEGNRTFWIMLSAMGALFVAGLAGATWLNHRLLVAPLQQLVAGTQAVAAGDLETKVALNRGDELGALADSFNTMVDQLRSRSETLIEKESQYRSIFEATSDGLLLFTVDGALIEANPACCEMHGYTPEEFLQLRPASFIHQEDMLLFGDFVAAVAAGGEFRTRARDIRKDGSQFPIEVLGRPFVSMGTPLLMAVIRDITEQVETERVLEERVETRTQELDALLRADAELFRSLDLDEVLKALCDIAVDLLGADKSVVTIWDRELRSVSIRASRSMSASTMELLQRTMLSGQKDPLPDDVEPNVFESPEDLQNRPEFRELFEREGVQASIDMPMRDAKGLVLGGYAVAYTQPHKFGADERRLLEALAERAAVAIGNAELYARAQQAASLEERQRLARELHDSVSQALYGIALGARTARTLLDQDPSKAAEPVDYVLSLAEAGLTEMRALIFELRPESLAMEGIVAALDKQIAAARARHGLDISFESCEEPETSLETKEAIYRVAQEALHNIVKHAKATHVDVSLQHTDGAIELVVNDDGVGFDPSGDFAGHLGLRSMRERAAKIGSSLVVESVPGAGTTVRFNAKAG